MEIKIFDRPDEIVTNRGRATLGHAGDECYNCTTVNLSLVGHSGGEPSEEVYNWTRINNLINAIRAAKPWMMVYPNSQSTPIVIFSPDMRVKSLRVRLEPISDRTRAFAELPQNAGEFINYGSSKCGGDARPYGRIKKPNGPIELNADYWHEIKPVDIGQINRFIVGPCSAIELELCVCQVWDGTVEVEPPVICAPLVGALATGAIKITSTEGGPNDFIDLNNDTANPAGCNAITFTDQNGLQHIWQGGSLIVSTPINLPPYHQINYQGAPIPSNFVGPLAVTFNCADSPVNNADCVTLEVPFTPPALTICDCPTIAYKFACWCGANGSAVPNNGTLNTYLATYTGGGTVQLSDIALREKGTSNFATLGLVQDSAGQAVWVVNSTLANPNGVNVYTLEGTNSEGIAFSIDFEIVPNATGFKRAYAGINFQKATLPENCSVNLPSVDEYFHIFSTPVSGVGFGPLALGLNEYEFTAQSEGPAGTILTSKQSILVECA